NGTYLIHIKLIIYGNCMSPFYTIMTVAIGCSQVGAPNFGSQIIIKLNKNNVAMNFTTTGNAAIAYVLLNSMRIPAGNVYYAAIRRIISFSITACVYIAVPVKSNPKKMILLGTS